MGGIYFDHIVAANTHIGTYPVKPDQRNTQRKKVVSRAHSAKSEEKIVKEAYFEVIKKVIDFVILQYFKRNIDEMTRKRL